MSKKITTMLFIAAFVFIVAAVVFNKDIETNNNTKQIDKEIINEVKDINKKHIDNLSQKSDKLRAELENIESEIKKTNEKIKIDTKILKDAKSNFNLANDDYVRYKNAYKDGAVTKFDMDNATKNYESLSNSYKKAANTLKFDENKLKTLTSKKQYKEQELNKLILEIENKFKD